MSNDHDHNHTQDIKNINVLFTAFILTFLFMIVEFIGGFFSNSLALISDAGHMISDAGSLGISIGAIYLGSKKSNLLKTFGYKRIETISAFVNGITLVVISILIFKEGIERILHPMLVKQETLIIIAFIGLLVNILVAFLLLKNSKDSVNIRGAFLHVLGDLLGSIGAIIAGFIIYFTGWLYADPIVSIIISIIIFSSSISLLKETFNTLMEGVPKDIDVISVINEIKTIKNIQDVHDIHIWSLSDSKVILTAHLIIDFNLDNKNLLSKIKELLHHKFNIEHSTFEIEYIHCNNECNF